MPAASDPVNTTSSPSFCPLCGASNECGQVAGVEECWCMTTRIPSEVLDQIPTEARNRACICRACAAKASAKTSQP